MGFTSSRPSFFSAILDIIDLMWDWSRIQFTVGWSGKMLGWMGLGSIAEWVYLVDVRFHVPGAQQTLLVSETKSCLLSFFVYRIALTIMCSNMFQQHPSTMGHLTIIHGFTIVTIWLVVSNIFISISYLECHRSHWRTP